MPQNKKKEPNLSENLKKLSEISAWFASQKEIDLEAGLEKVREAASLVKTSKNQLEALENEFKEIEKEFGFGEEKNFDSGL